MPSTRNRQKGVVLLGLMIVFVLASGLYLIGHINRLYSKSGQYLLDASVLQQATDALLARAVSDANRPGSLPCPALNSDGTAPVSSPCPTFIGWLPWRTLDLPDLRDSSGERLWYVLSPAFQDNAAVNSTSVSALTLDGSTGIAAVVIAPGFALPSQNRPSNNAADYLDAKDGNPATSNSDGDSTYFSGPIGDKFNDKALPLTTSVLFSGVSKRILGEIRYAYTAGSAALLPFADSDGDGLSNSGINTGQFPYKNPEYATIASPSWYSSSTNHYWHASLESNGWFPLVVYARSSKTISLNGQVVTLP